MFADTPFSPWAAQCPPPARPPLAPPAPGPGLGSVVQPCAQAQAPKTPVRLRISLFYDGTGNNRTNVDLGPAFKSDDSYRAGHTNVARLESAGVLNSSPRFDAHLTLYTEGIGTVDRGEDSSRGYALGTGDTGVHAKVDSGVVNALDRIRDFAAGRPIAVLHFDTFGFSRGAAAARLCVWKCMQESGKTMRDRLVAMGYTVGEIKVHFVGLFDTVASYGANHSNDTAELHLDAIAQAAQVVQLAAGDEHRANFGLTNIRSAGAKGRQIFLPGAHADVGGGYAAVEDEVGLQLVDEDLPYATEPQRNALQRQRQWLVAAGWYTEAELSGVNFWNELRGSRRGIPNTYSFIPLLIMARFAREAGVNIDPNLEVDFRVPPSLSTAQSAIQAYVARGASHAADWLNDRAVGLHIWLRQLRHDHLHFSARYWDKARSMAPQWTTSDITTARRVRIIQDG